MRRLFDRLRSALAPSAESGTVTNIAKAVAFGDDRQAAHAAQRWAQEQQERAEREAERRQADESAASICRAVQSDGVWFPPEVQARRWNRFR